MLIGRDAEAEKLREAQLSNASEFVAVYGRRRVGKTYLVREVFGNSFAFYHTGVANVGREIQLDRFAHSLRRHGFSVRRKPRNWYSAFDLLEEGLTALPPGKKVIFIDELPWMDSPKSDFVSAVDSFWNGWASARRDIVLVVCGSATSWMTDKIIDNHGGLHNRITRRIRLEPFTLAECERFALAKGIAATRRHILEYYMAMGGIPYYWDCLRKDLSPAQNIDAMFFAVGGELRDEYGHLYASLFKKPERHIAIVEALGRRKAGMTRMELISKTGLDDNGAFGKALSELAECGFIRRYRMPGKLKRDAIYQLIDNYTLFHFRFLADLDPAEPGSWTAIQNTPAANVWRGLSFERVCLSHVEQIKRKLGISGVATRQFAWRSSTDAEGGAQIDLLVERADDAANICEMKYSSGKYEIDKAENRKMLNRRDRFVSETGFCGAVYLTLVTTCGAVHNAYWSDIQSEVTLDDLFRDD